MTNYMGTLKFTITYDIGFDCGRTWTNKIMIVKNCDDKYSAESKLAKYLKMKYDGVDSIRIIKCIGDSKDTQTTSSVIDEILESGLGGQQKQYNSILDKFGDIFGGINNFKL